MMSYLAVPELVVTEVKWITFFMVEARESLNVAKNAQLYCKGSGV